jgi:hypothetical protein
MVPVGVIEDTVLDTLIFAVMGVPGYDVDGISVIRVDVKSAWICSLMAELVEPPYVPSPEYTAVNECEPTPNEFARKEATPDDMVEVPIKDPLSKKFTVPVGADPPEPVTEAVSVSPIP